MTTEAVSLLKAGLEELGFKYSGKQIDAFLTYLEELKKWNKAYNLTGLKTDREIIIKHFFDSLLFAKVLPSQAMTLADIGSGAGFPGVPVKIMLPHLKVFLIEPTQKKAVFLRHVSNRLKLQDIEVIDRRIEDVKDLKVDVAVTRALYSVREFVDKAKDILNKNGILILSKGPGLEKELNGLSKEQLAGISSQDIVLPFENAVRHIVSIQL